MKYLPQYWAIKIDKEHPLWKKFEEYIAEVSAIMKNGTQDWIFIGRDNDYGLNNGYNMTRKMNYFNNHSEIQLITLEQFFGETLFEIY